MATFKLYKASGNKALYRQEGSGASVRFPARMFEGAPPETVEIEAPFAPVSAGPGPKAEIPAEIREAAEKLKAFRAQRKAEREEKRKAREADRQARGLPPVPEKAKKAKKKK